MTRINKLDALQIAKQLNVTNATIYSFDANDARKAFCSVHFDFTGGGAGKSFQISKDTYKALAETGLFKIGQA